MTTQTLSPSIPTSAPAATFHPMDTSRVLLSLMQLARDSEARPSEEANVEWVVSPWTLRRLLSAIHYRDEAILLHSRRVALMAVGIARHLGWEERPLRKLEVAALLHDIGKVGIPQHILGKPGRLSPDEQEYVQLHHTIGTDLLQACRIDREIVETTWYSHTTGRVVTEPDADANSQIPQGARILAVADAYDSLRNDQPYRRGKSHDETMRILHEQSGKQFDRNVIAALNRWLGPSAKEGITDDSGVHVAIRASVPVDSLTVAEAGTLAQIISFVHLLETLYDGFCLIDADLRFVVWNHALQRLTGLAARHAVGESWSRKLLNLTDADKKPLADRNCPVAQVLATGAIRCGTYKLEHRRNGQWRDVEVQTIPLIDESNRLHGVAQIYRDVSQVRGNAGQYQQLQMAARRDPLTGVGNRGELEARLGRLFVARNEKKDSSPFSVIFLDIDHFKSINDTHGHGVGDRVLIDLARLVSDELYSGEVVCRYGGEEFVVLCPDTVLAAAVERAERLRRTIADASLGKPATLTVTASFGVAQVEPGDLVEKLLHRADQALYDAKRSGRNRTCFRSLEKGNRSGKAAREGDQEGTPFVCQADMTARVAADIIHYKLNGFVEDVEAKLKAVTSERVEMRVGQPTLLGSWGKTGNRQPVEIVLEISEPKQIGKWATQHVSIRATITPAAGCPSDEVFQIRARHVLQHLRAYLGAE